MILLNRTRLNDSLRNWNSTDNRPDKSTYFVIFPQKKSNDWAERVRSRLKYKRTDISHIAQWRLPWLLRLGKTMRTQLAADRYNYIHLIG